MNIIQNRVVLVHTYRSPSLAPHTNLLIKTNMVMRSTTRKSGIQPRKYPLLCNYLRNISSAEKLHQNLSLIGEEDAKGFEQSLVDLYFYELKLAAKTEKLTQKLENLIFQHLGGMYSSNSFLFIHLNIHASLS